MQTSNCHTVPSRVESPLVPIAPGLRLPNGVTAAGITPDQPIRMFWDRSPTQATAFRVTLAIDDRTHPVSLLHGHRLDTRERIFTLDIRYSGSFKIQSADIPASAAAAIAASGLELRLENAGYLHLIQSAPGESQTLLPHLLKPTDASPVEWFLRQMRCPTARHPFGWLGGCVMDGQAALHARYPDAGFERALREIYLDDFFRDGSIFAEAPGAKPCDGQYYGIEATLPVAQLARLMPAHPAIDIAVDFWLSRRRAGGEIMDHGSSTEGCYTIAWPMACVATARGRDDLKRIAIDQCRHRLATNRAGGAMWQYVAPSGERRLANWCRGVGWYMLGTVRTLLETRFDDNTLTQSIEDLATWLETVPLDGGVFRNFIDDPTSRADCSGSAAIVAAILLATDAGYVRRAHRAFAEARLESLVAHLTADGLLTGCAQENKGGESLQRSDYRVISQMGMGLLAQALAAR